MFDWVRLDLFDFAVTANATGALAYPAIRINLQKSSAFPPTVRRIRLWPLTCSSPRPLPGHRGDCVPLLRHLDRIRPHDSARRCLACVPRHSLLLLCTHLITDFKKTADRPQLLLLILGILAALLVCVVFGFLLAFACRCARPQRRDSPVWRRYYRSVAGDTDARTINSERTRLING